MFYAEIFTIEPTVEKFARPIHSSLKIAFFLHGNFHLELAFQNLSGFPGIFS